MNLSTYEMPRETELKLLAQSRRAFHNAASNALIRQLLEEVDYDVEEIQAGQTHAAEAQAAYDACEKEKTQKRMAHIDFTKKKEALKKRYSTHRKKASALFDESPEVKITLGIVKRTPKAHFKWLQSVKGFYGAAIANERIRTQFASMRVSQAELQAARQLILAVEEAYSAYLEQKRKASRAVEAKNKVLAALKKRLSAFYRIASIALEDQIQLMESLDKIIKG